MMRRLLPTLLLTALPMFAQDLTRLPLWAQAPALETKDLKAPEQADAWVLLDRTELAYTGSGEILQHHFRLVKVLTDLGTQEATYLLHGLGGKATKVKRVKGWNLKPDGEVVKLDADEVVTFNSDDGDALTTHTATGARLAQVQRGSLVAFESVEALRHPLGPTAFSTILEGHPIRRWEFIPAVAGGGSSYDPRTVKIRLDLRHAAPWIPPQAGITPTALRLDNLPALPKEEGRPPARNVTPWVVLSFQDPALTTAPGLDSWDTLAKWFHGSYQTKVTPLATIPVAPGPPRQRLTGLGTWIAREMTYKQVYLAPERGWIPETSLEVLRKRYGDCKDLTSCLLGGAAAMGFVGYPALARIASGEIEPDEPVSIATFNHVITALRLPESLGLAAEVQTPAGRLLLVDPTARHTPLGYLPEAHRGGRVLVCTPEGAVWVAVPPTALEPAHLRVEVTGDEYDAHLLDGMYTFVETGDFLGLRSTCHLAGPAALKDHLAARWDFPPTATLEISSTSDPMDLSQPFTLKVKVHGLPLLQPAMGEWSLSRVGFPGVPGALQRPGTPRQFPIWIDPDPGTWDVVVRLTLQTVLQPVDRTLALETPFRTLSGTCKVEGRKLELTFGRTRKGVRFSFDQREEGLKQAKRDRSQTKSALDEFLIFKPQP